MEVLNYSDFRKHLKKSLDKASIDQEIVVVSRSNEKNVVVLSLKEYNSLTETLHLLSSEKNRRRLSESIAEFETGKSLNHPLIED